MYNLFFGFKENPFNLTPDPRYLFLSRYHKEALDHLFYGINERKGFIAITGGIGTGKTTLCRAFLSQLDASTQSALIFNSFVSDNELLKIINQEFGIATDTGSETNKDYTDALNRFLLENFSKGKNAVLLIDEAQNLSHSVLEQIRMLSNLETEKEKLIQIILVGQPELKELLCTPCLKQLDERITVRYDLKPLDLKDIKGYVEHRLVVAGNRGVLKFTKAAIQKVYLYSRGNPRRINAVCDRALLIAYAKEKHNITASMITKAIDEIRGGTITGGIKTSIFIRTLSPAAWLVMLLFVVTALGGLIFREELFNLSQTRHKAPGISNSLALSHPKTSETIALTLFWDEQGSLSELFNIFNATRAADSLAKDDAHFDLISLNIGPQNYMRLKKPFRLLVPDSKTDCLSFPCYLLIREVKEEAAVIIDSNGKEQVVPKKFIIKNWGLKLSWFFPYGEKKILPAKAMNPSDILALQKSLSKTGYSVQPTGILDASTLVEIKKLQKDFGLTADGIVGPRTRALLYLMS